MVAGQHAQEVHDEVVAFPPQTREVPFDEKWSYVAKKKNWFSTKDADEAENETT